MIESIDIIHHPWRVTPQQGNHVMHFTNVATAIRSAYFYRCSIEHQGRQYVYERVREAWKLFPTSDDNRPPIPRDTLHRMLIESLESRVAV